MGLTQLWILSVVTLNVWGLPSFLFKELAPAKEQRMQVICKKLYENSKNPNGWDVVFLQEVWLAEDRKLFKNCGFNYFVDLDPSYKNFDSGLLILSRFPIESNSSRRITYSENGDPMRVLKDGEFLANKSAILAKVQHPAGPVWVANTHLVSFYDKQDVYLKQRDDQLKAFIDWVEQTTYGEPVVLGGDFNIGPGSSQWVQLLNRLQTYQKVQHNSGLCSYRKSHLLDASQPCKFDHLFSSAHFQPFSGRLVFDGQISRNKEKIPVSDHYGWESNFVFSKASLKATGPIRTKKTQIERSGVGQPIQVDVTRVIKRVQKAV